MKYTNNDLRHLDELRNKMRIMGEFGEFAYRNFARIKDVRLEVFEKQLPKVDSFGRSIDIEEFLVVEYEGGGKSVDNVNMNSNSANLRLATQRLDGGHYDLEYYNSIVNDKSWKRVTDESITFKEEQKQEALLRLNILAEQGLDVGLNCIRKDFESGEHIYYSEYQNSVFKGVLYWLDNKPEFMKIKEDVEKKCGGLVYHGELSHTTEGDMLTLFYVSKNKNEWKMDREDLRNHLSVCYVHNFECPDFSEFGTISFACVNGGLMRTDIGGREIPHKPVIKKHKDELVR